MFWSKNTIRNLSTVPMTVAVFFMIGIGNAKADFVFGKPVNMGTTVNSSNREDSPCISADGLSLYFQSNRPGSSGTWDIWVSTRETVNAPWGEPVNLGPTVNSSAWDSIPSITANGELHFSSTRSGGYGDMDGWVSTRATVHESWSTPVNLGPELNGSSTDAVEISFDGLTALITSNRSGGYGGMDLWISTRPTFIDAWSEPVNLGQEVNSSGWDMDTALSADNRFLFFTSPQSGGFGGDDIWLITRETTEDAWSTPVNLGQTVNTSYHDSWPGISYDGSTLYFCSNRPGGSGAYDLWQISIMPIVDFNGDSQVDIKDLIKLIEHWGQNEPSVDIGPTPFGDGVVDAADLEVLMRHWGKEVHDSHLLAHWALDGTEGDVAYDSSMEHDATVTGNALWQPDIGQIDGALQFDGIDDYLIAPFILDPVKQPFSVFAWIKGGQPGQTIISQQGAFGAWLSVDSVGALSTGLTFPLPPVTSNVVITDDLWHRVGLVSDGSGMSLYVDGTEVIRSNTSPILPANGDLQIGVGQNLEPDSFWSGMIDDVRIYDRVVEP
jgi:hypothetical protein